MEQHFDVLSSIITTWVDGRCIGQTSSVTTTEFDSMKRYITCYLQSAIQLEMIKKVVSRVLWCQPCLGRQTMAFDAYG